MVTDETNLRSTLKDWLRNSALVAETRNFLKSGPSSNRSGLGDAQLANWKTRGLPTSFVEGAALYHCAARRQWIGIEADTFWQVFIVHDVKDQENMDCSVFRYWQGVRDLRDTADNTHLTHHAFRSNTVKKKSNARSLPEGDLNFRTDPEDDGVVFVSWEIGPEPRDCGYALRFSDVIAKVGPDAVGGYPGIPVSSARMLTFLPPSIRQRQQKPLGNPRAIPSAIATLLTGNPARVIDDYLGIRKKEGFKGNYYRLGVWFQEGPQVTQVTQVKELFQSDLLPKAIREDSGFNSAFSYQAPFEIFATQDNEPWPFLHYFMVFG